MRYVLATLLVTAVAAAPALGAGVDPRALVVRTSEVPAGFAVDRQHTGTRTNEDEANGSAASRRFLERTGRITGYLASWDRGRGPDTITARVDLFRTRAGARMLLDRYVDEARKSGAKGLRRSSVPIGDWGWVWHTQPGAPAGDLGFVFWQSGRVVAGVAGWGISRALLLELARTQQGRIAAALR
jgi:hypothetical protein